MAHAKVSKDEVLDHALELFRTSGFEGVSLSDLSAATGLEKPSLYFRFPGGRKKSYSLCLTGSSTSSTRMCFVHC